MTARLVLMACCVAVLVGFSVAVWSCAPRPQDQALCEEAAKRDMPSPATYNLIEANSYEVDGEKMVAIEFDAQNVYGAVVRDHYFCTMDDNRTSVVKMIGGLEVKRSLPSSF